MQYTAAQFIDYLADIVTCVMLCQGLLFQSSFNSLINPANNSQVSGGHQCLTPKTILLRVPSYVRKLTRSCSTQWQPNLLRRTPKNCTRRSRWSRATNWLNAGSKPR